MSLPPPLSLLAELTHRCPMRCVYCSNPLALQPSSRELDTASWQRVLDEAAELGVLQVHFSGGEPTVRRDLAALIRHAAARDLYTNLITAGVLLDRDGVAKLAAAGLEHLQLSLQDSDAAAGERIGGLQGAHQKKRAVAGWAVGAGLALTINVVVHRANAARVRDIIRLAIALGAARVEIAHAQYYGWALLNRDALLPGREQIAEVGAVVEAERRAHAGSLLIDYVPPDYYARLPKACMGGWGQRFIVIDPAGYALPCHAAMTIPGLRFECVRERSLGWIWEQAPAFNRFRGTAWMPQPCASCERREVDWGGCRCQALALAGDAAATDPVCHKSSQHPMLAAIIAEAEGGLPGASPLVYRGSTIQGSLPPDDIRGFRTAGPA